MWSLWELETAIFKVHEIEIFEVDAKFQKNGRTNW